MREITIRTEWIKLGQLMKLAGWIQNGSDAKILLTQGKVRLNGAAESRRGKKVFPGDEAAMEGEETVRVAMMRVGASP